MVYLLIFLLIVEFWIFYIFNGREFLSPSIISTCSFLFASLCYVIYLDSGGIDLQFVTVIVIIGYLPFLFMGEWIAKHICIGRKLKTMPLDDTGYIYIAKRKIYIATLFVLFVSIGYFYTIYVQSLTLGNTAGNFLLMTKFVREAENGLDYGGKNRLFRHGCLFAQVLVCYFVYVYFRNKSQGITEKRLLLPVLGFVPCMIANSARTQFLLMFCIIFVFWYVLTFRIKRNHIKADLFLLAQKIGPIFLLVLILFWGLGFRKDSSNLGNFGATMAGYAGAGIYGFDYFIKNGENDDVLLLQVTLHNYYGFLRSKGFDIPFETQHGAEFYYANGKSNIYTMCKPLVKQYGYFFGWIELFFWGLVFSYVFKRARINHSFTTLFFLGNLMFPLSMSGISYVHYYTLSIGLPVQLLFAWLISKYLPRIHFCLRESKTQI